MQMAAVVDVLATQGIDTARVLARAGLTHERLADPRARMGIHEANAIWEAALSESGDPALALRVALGFAPGTFGSFEYVLRNCETLDQVFERATELMRLLDDCGRVEYSVDDAVLTFRLYRDSPHQTLGVSNECTFAVLSNIARQRGWPVGAWTEVRFKHHTRAEHARYEAYFGCRVRFGCEANEMCCHASLLGIPLASDTNLRLLMEDHARRQLAEVPAGDPFLHAVRSNLLAQLREGPPQLAKLTHQLHTTERTLRRRLQSAGTGYQQLLDEVRAQLAQEYMAQPHQDATTVAAHLGFTDPSTFYRAFKRWTGRTPAQYQRDRSTNPTR